MKKLYFYQTGIGKIGIAENQGSITDIFFGSEKVPRDILLEETSLLREAFWESSEGLIFLFHRKEPRFKKAFGALFVRSHTEKPEPMGK